MLHRERGEDVLRDVAFVALAGDGLHQQPQRDIARIAVLPGRADRLRELGRAEAADLLLQRAVTHIPAGRHLAVAHAPWQPAGVVEQVAHGDARGGRGIGDAEAGQVALHGRVELELAGLDQLHDGQGGEGLRRRADHEGGLGRHGAPGGVSLAEALQVDDAVALHDGERDPRHPRRTALPFDVGVDGRPLGVRMRPGRTAGCGCERRWPQEWNVEHAQYRDERDEHYRRRTMEAPRAEHTARVHGRILWLRRAAMAGRPLTIERNRLAGHARPSTSPRIRNRKYTLCAEWTITDIQVLCKRLAGSAYSSAPRTIEASMIHGWCR